MIRTPFLCPRNGVHIKFRSTFYKDFKSLFDKDYIDWKRKIAHSFNGICVDGKVRYSEYLPAKEVYRHLMRLNECYEVAFYKGTLYKKTEELKMLSFKGFNLFNKKEIEKATKNINNEMDEYAEDFYDDKKDKEKGDGFEL